LAGYQLVYLTEEKKFPISFGTIVANSGCLFKVLAIARYDMISVVYGLYAVLLSAIFSERINSRSRSLYVIVRPSVVCLSVCSVRAPYILRRLKFSAMFLRHLVRWPSADTQVKFYGDRPRGTPLSGELNTRGVAEYSDLGHIERYISETVQDRR